MKKDIFSIIIPVYNGELTIERALASLISNKEYICEVIIINDRSTDDTLKLVEQFRPFFNIEIYENTGNKGPGPARKVGMKKAKGKWITFLDADDCLTASSLEYVYGQLQNRSKLAVLHCKTIYYEMGSFVAKDIDYSDFSCGGNFYRKAWLRKNNLYPHDELFLSEDEYFNNKVRLFLDHLDKEDSYYDHYDYPVYEVHHDSHEKSFSHGNWEEYICKYHLLYKQYIVDDFIQYDNMKDMLLDDYIDSLILNYFFALSCDTKSAFDYFQEGLEFLEKKFGKDKYYLYECYEDIGKREYLWSSAKLSTGITGKCPSEYQFGIFLKIEEE